MSPRNPKFYVARRHSNRISHRALTTYERRNPEMFALSSSAHDTWAGAHAHLIAAREKDLAKAQNELRRATNALARVRAMKEAA